MNKNELETTINKYFSNEKNTVHYYGSGNGAEEFLQMQSDSKMDYRDAPDMYIKKNNLVYIVEHFEFDCYKKTRKGSKNKQEQARINKKSETFPATEEGVIFHDIIHGESSFDNYINNAINAFEDHYKHIDVYIENLKRDSIINENDIVKVVFFIEDVSPLGSIAIERKGYNANMIAIVLAQCKQFIELIKDREKVNYVIACSETGNNNSIWFIDRNDIDDYLKNVVDFENMDFLSCEPHVIEGKMLISNEKMQKI